MNSKELKDKLESLHSDSFGWALHCCNGNEVLAADVLQSTYLKILDGKAKYKAKSAFKTWLFAIIRYTAFDQLKRNNQHQMIDWESRELSNQPDQTSLAIDQLEHLEHQQFFRKALNQLSPKQSQLLHLVFYQNLTIQEAAEVMNIQLGTARTHYERGKQQLKKCLLKIGFNHPSKS